MFPINRQPRQPFPIGQGLNPFRRHVQASRNEGSTRVNARSSTWAPTGTKDGTEIDVVGEPLTQIYTSPPLLEPENIATTTEGSVHEEALNVSDVQERTSSICRSIGRSSQSSEQKARQRFIRKFVKKTVEKEDDEPIDDRRGERKRPWYKGKFLYHRPFTVRNQLQATIFNSWFNVLLVCTPIGFVLNYTHANPNAVFFVNFVAILPLAGIIGTAMDDLILRTGNVVGALVYMSFGNIVQSITSIFLLRSRQIATLKTSLIGGILTLILLNNGVAFFFGGLRRREQFYNTLVATVFNGLLSVSIAAFVIPTASFYFSATAIPVITKQSRGMAILLMILYGLYLFFELKTHSDGFNEESKKVAMRPLKGALPPGAIQKGLAKAGGVGAGPGRAQLEDRVPNDELVNSGAFDEDEEDEEWPQLYFLVCLGVLVIGTAILAFNTQFMTDSIQGLTEKAHVPKDFIGMILLPILSNDAMAINCAVKDQMDLAIQSALGKSLQTALVVAPILVVVGWGLGIDEMNLLFDGFQVSALFVSILLAQQCILDGTSNWLKGAILTMTYIIIAVASWFQGEETIDGI